MLARALAPACLLLAAALAGCVGTSADLDPSRLPGLPRGLPYDTSRGWSLPLEPPLYEILEAVQELVPSFDDTPISIGVFLPAMEGCDWGAESLPATCKLPAVMDAGPYYGPRILQDKFRPPTIEWLVPRGYAVVQMSLRGTGESGGCLEYKSLKDIDDVSAVIDWLAARPWSNGNVGMIGRSYDGTSAWAGAASGNPHLKTIVPISGAVDAPDLYYKNGTSEFRGAIHGTVYWPPYGLGLGDGGPPTRRAGQWSEELCKEAVLDVHEESARASATGDASSEYWQSRDLTGRILEKYRGSVWVIHGLQDWNVNPSQVVPFLKHMQAAGIEAKAWLGVWGHAYPDRVDEHRNVRWDWGQKTLDWFDHHLKGEPLAPAPAVEVEDNLFVWRGEATYPPDDLAWREFALAPEGALAEPGAGGQGSFLLAGGGALSLGESLGPAGDRAVFTSEPLPAPLRIAGLPQLHVTVTPSTPAGGHLFAELVDVFPDGRTMRLGWAAMNLRFHEGGNTEPRDLVPGRPVVARMEFEPADALFAQGHRVRLVVHRDGVEDINPSPSGEPLQVALGSDSLLRLPAIGRGTTLPVYVPPGLAG